MRRNSRQFIFWSYKTIRSVCILSCLIPTACSYKTIPNNTEVRDYCKLKQSNEPINLRFGSIRNVLNDFEQSKAPHEALWVKMTGGRPLLFCRIQLQDRNVYSWSGEEGEKVRKMHRMGYQKFEQMFINIPSAHYTEQPFSKYASEPGLEAILIKKAGVTVFSYVLDRECLDSFAAADEAKIAHAKALANYMRGLL